MTGVPEIRFFERDILSSPFKFYATAFARHPIIKVAGQDVYCVFSDKLVREVIRRVEDFSSDFGSFTMGARADDPQIKAITSQGWPFVKTLVIADPPVHTRFRKLVNAAFSKRRIDPLEGSIRAIAERLLDRAVEGEAFDFVGDLAVPLPVEVISDLLGLRELDIDTVKRWSDAILERFGGRGLIDRERELQCAREILAFQRAMMALIAKRRARSEDDLISDLASAKLEDERPLDDVEILSILQQVMAAGNETTTIALTRGLLLLMAHPDQQQRAREDFSRIPAMVEEILRIESPAQSVWRITKRATTLGAARLPEGTMVMARVGAANRDPEAFAAPDRFDIDRQDVSNHVAFGRGIHTCLGNLLARKELVVGFQTIFSKLENIRVAPGASTEFLPDLVHPSLPSLPIEFTRIRP